MTRGVLAVLALVIVLPGQGAAQSNPASAAARSWRQQHERAIVDEFIGLLALPNIARDRDGIQRNAEAIVALMKKRGIDAALVSVPGGNPIVFGEIRTPGATRTIGLYAHYDGQPVDPKDWHSAPFTAVLRDKPIEQNGVVIPLPPADMPFDPESRLYARSAADDKAPIIAILAALDAIRAGGLQTRSNIKFAFEGEEEANSPNLERTLAANRDRFAGDLWLVCDAPLHQTRRQSIIFGSRGITALDLTVYGPRAELHSGHYGNWAPNPALAMARLLASMKDDSGRVLVDGFYTGVEPLGPTERRALAEAPAIDAGLMQELWLGAHDGGPASLTELLTQPSLNIRGLASARVGDQAAGVIPATATASLDVRTVRGMDVQRTVARIVDHIRKQGYFVVEEEPTAEVRRAHPKVAKLTVRPGGYNAVRTPMDLPIVQDVIRTVESARGPAVKIPTMGAGVPLESIERPLGTRTVIVPIGNHDNNQHSSDENLRIQNLWDGIELMAALLTM
jgi:acetylornithine deacetylase/succinyl-diaminopimelate desuccinylase-like protein